MRFMHTSDWHLGRLFYGTHLTDDQAVVLQQFVELVREQKPDAVIIAGDIYDRTVPPPDAVSLLDEVLTKIAIEDKVPVVMIAGNHDSPQRVGFAARLLRSHNLFVVGQLGKVPEVVALNDQYGPVHIAALPYAEPAAVRSMLANDDLAGHNAAMGALLAASRKYIPSQRSILVAHAFAAGCSGSESERPLSIGGSEFVDAAHFAGFNYVALGHLHRPQIVDHQEHIRYSGSLLKYSFEEATHAKCVLMVDLDAQGHCTTTPFHLTPRRDVRIISGAFQEILTDEKRYPSSEDYLCVQLEDTQPILDAIGRLRQRFPNAMQIERPGLVPVSSDTPTRVDHRKLDDLALFKAFHNQVCGEAMDESTLAELTTLLQAFAKEQEDTHVG